MTCQKERTNFKDNLSASLYFHECSNISLEGIQSSWANKMFKRNFFFFWTFKDRIIPFNVTQKIFKHIYIKVTLFASMASYMCRGLKANTTFVFNSFWHETCICLDYNLCLHDERLYFKVVKNEKVKTSFTELSKSCMK